MICLVFLLILPVIGLLLDLIMAIFSFYAAIILLCIISIPLSILGEISLLIHITMKLIWSFIGCYLLSHNMSCVEFEYYKFQSKLYFGV